MLEIAGLAAIEERECGVEQLVGIGRLLRRQQRELAAIQSTISWLADEYRGGGAPVEIIDRADIGRQIDLMLRAGDAEVRCLVKRDGLPIGRVHRAIYEPPATAQVGHARILAELPVNMVLSGWAAIVGSGDSVTIVRARGLLDALAALFERLWESATPPGDGSTKPSTEDLHLLSLLVAGRTDHAIAAQLGLSSRTVQRRIRVLLESAGVQTRVQLVWQAAQRGWL